MEDISLDAAIDVDNDLGAAGLDGQESPDDGAVDDACIYKCQEALVESWADLTELGYSGRQRDLERFFVQRLDCNDCREDFIQIRQGWRRSNYFL